MANVQKYTRARIGGLTRHYERAKKENGEYYQFSNQEIDVAKTHLNYNLAPTRDQLAFISRRTSEVECVSRANINVMCSWVVTAPKELDEGELHQFFEESYKFLNDRYAVGSDKNVVSAYVHMDEVSPHLHYAFVPVVHDEKKGIDKVSAKAVINRRDLQTFHQDLERHMAAIFGREIGILNEATKDGNKSIEELKRGSAQQEMDAICAEVNDLQAEQESISARIRSEVAEVEEYLKKARATTDSYKVKQRALEAKLEALDAKIKGHELTREKIQEIPVKISKPLLGGDGSETATIPLTDWKDVKKTALMRVDTKAEILALKQQITDLQKTVDWLKREKSALEREKKGLQASVKEQMSVLALQRKLQYVPRGDLERFIAQYQPVPARKPVNRDKDWDLDR